MSDSRAPRFDLYRAHIELPHRIVARLEDGSWSAPSMISPNNMTGASSRWDQLLAELVI